MSRALKVHLLLAGRGCGVASLPIFYGFQWHLTLHILSAILFVGGLVSSNLVDGVGPLQRNGGSNGVCRQCGT